MSKKSWYFLLLIIFFPTIMAVGDSCGDRSFSNSTQILILANPLISLVDIISELSKHKKIQFHCLVLIQVYSLLLILLIYFSLIKYSTKAILNNFLENITFFYSKKYLWGLILIVFIITSLFSNKQTQPINLEGFSEKYFIFNLFYLFVYFAALFIIIEKFYLLKKDEKLLTLFFVFLFPVVSISSEYQSVRFCYSENEVYYENHTTIFPLIYAIPKTVLSFFQYLDNDKFSYPIIPRLYSTIQIVFIVFLFPSLLKIKDAK